MRPIQLHNPAEMHDTGTAVTASLVVMLAAAGLVVALEAPAVLVTVGALAFVALSARRLAGLRKKRRDRRATQVCVPATEICVEV